VSVHWARPACVNFSRAMQIGSTLGTFASLSGGTPLRKACIPRASVIVRRGWEPHSAHSHIRAGRAVRCQRQPRSDTLLLCLSAAHTLLWMPVISRRNLSKIRFPEEVLTRRGLQSAGGRSGVWGVGRLQKVPQWDPRVAERSQIPSNPRPHPATGPNESPEEGFCP